MEKYRATIGHKVNDRTIQPMATYISIDHPRFGSIKAVKALQDIRKGQQVFSFYGYVHETTAPRWYRNGLLASAGQCVAPRHG